MQLFRKDAFTIGSFCGIYDRLQSLKEQRHWSFNFFGQKIKLSNKASEMPAVRKKTKKTKLTSCRNPIAAPHSRWRRCNSTEQTVDNNTYIHIKHMLRWVWCPIPRVASVPPLANGEQGSAPSHAKRPADVEVFVCARSWRRLTLSLAHSQSRACKFSVILSLFRDFQLCDFPTCTSTLLFCYVLARIIMDSL